MAIIGLFPIRSADRMNGVCLCQFGFPRSPQIMGSSDYFWGGPWPGWLFQGISPMSNGCRETLQSAAIPLKTKKSGGRLYWEATEAAVRRKAEGGSLLPAPMESFFATLKKELVHHEHDETRAEARHSLFEYIEVFYNRVRRHSALGDKSPSQFAETLSPLSRAHESWGSPDTAGVPAFQLMNVHVSGETDGHL